MRAKEFVDFGRGRCISHLIFETLDHAWGFTAELCPEGLIGIAGSLLRYVCSFCSLCWDENMGARCQRCKCREYHTVPIVPTDALPTLVRFLNRHSRLRSQHLPNTEIGDEDQARLHAVVIHSQEIHRASDESVPVYDRGRPSGDESRSCQTKDVRTGTLVLHSPADPR